MTNLIRLFTDPYSAAGLRHRASKLPDCPYKVLLELAAMQAEKKAASRGEIKKAVEYFRTGNPTLIRAGVKVLNLSQEQITEALCLFKTDAIKQPKEKTKETN